MEQERARENAALAARQAARNGSGALLPGTYNCIAGFGMMLTLGRITISGLSYRFQPPSGPATAGTYSVSPAGIRWNGNLGVIRSSDIATSGKEIGNPEVFWFKYRAPGHNATTTTSCHRLK